MSADPNDREAVERKKVMARPTDQALVSDGAATHLHPSGFDPSRWQAGTYEGKPRHLPKAESKELGKLIAAAREYIDGLTPYRRSLLAKAARSVSPVNCGWQHYKAAEIFVFELHRDSGGNPEGGDGTAPSRSDDSAGPQDIAQGGHHD